MKKTMEKMYAWMEKSMAKMTDREDGGKTNGRRQTVAVGVISADLSSPSSALLLSPPSSPPISLLRRLPHCRRCHPLQPFVFPVVRSASPSYISSFWSAVVSFGSVGVLCGNQSQNLVNLVGTGKKRMSGCADLRMSQWVTL